MLEEEYRIMNVYDNLNALQIKLPLPAAPGGVYAPVKQILPGLYYVSGCGPCLEGVPTKTGKLGQELTLTEGRDAARACALNLLAAIEAELGDLNRVTNLGKILAFVASDSSFYQHPEVVNGASELLRDVFGAKVGLPARSAIGVNVLPGNIPVEIELMFTAREKE
jgi:enamine deaminase RidA (YjgF/YER057c/UK114 family)